MGRPGRIVCYAVNGSGLGHVTRLAAVARWLRRFVAVLEQRPPEVLFLTSSDATDALERAGFASFKIPSKTAVRESGLDPLEYRRLAKHFVWQALGVFAPDLLVVDTLPAGSFDELFQVLDGPFKKGFVFRHVRQEYADRPIFRAALGLYDVVVVPHTEGDGSWARLAPGVDLCFSGEVLQHDREELPSREAGRAELGVANGHRLVYVSAGGGGDPGSGPTLSALVRALGDEPDLHLLVGAGPLYRGPRLGGDRLTWYTDPQVMRYFPACDAAASAAGYNTFHELLYVGVPSLFFAQDKVADDQAARIAAAEARGACHLLADPTDATSVVRGVRRLLEPEESAALRAACATVVGEGGARRCARMLLAPLYSPARLAWAAELLTPRVVQQVERQGGSALLGRLLPRVMPQEQAGDLRSHPGFEALLSRLSPATGGEVERVLGEDLGARERGALERSLIGLLERTAERGVELESAIGCLEQAMKKHPPGQEREPRWTPWICALLDGLQRCLSLELPGLGPRDVLQLYRAFPRLVDADAQRCFELFEQLVRRQSALGRPPHRILEQMQGLKLSHPRVTTAEVAALCGGAP